MSSFMSDTKNLKIPLEYIKQATNNFAKGNFIAKGGFGEVYKGELFFQSNVGSLAAVKRLTPSDNHADADFWREIMLLSEYKHENIILLLGFCSESKEKILVYEYAHNKSLDNHLHDPKFTWIQRLNVCLGAARGLEYLHNPRGGQKRVLHRDIKSGNILLDKNWNAKIADFGFSKFGPANQKHTMLISEPKGTFGYCDPVFLDTSFYTKESDVYSFGVVLSEVLCSRLCVDYKYTDARRSLPSFLKKSSKEQIRDKIMDDNLVQQMNEKSFDTFVTLVYSCLETEQKQRPSMESIITQLETALKYQEQRNLFFANNVNFGSSSTPYKGKDKRGLPAQRGQAAGKRQLEDIDLDDDIINAWSSGKEGNLRALLSTLHDILGPESGWNPVSLTDTKNSAVVREYYDEAVVLIRTFMKGGASSREEYICRKVIQILKAGLSRLNSEQMNFQEKKDVFANRDHHGSHGSESQLLCFGCGNLVHYPVGAPSVRCAVCNSTTHITAAPFPGNQVAYINCSNCMTTLMCPYGAQSMQCALCGAVTRTGVNWAPPLPFS